MDLQITASANRKDSPPEVRRYGRKTGLQPQRLTGMRQTFADRKAYKHITSQCPKRYLRRYAALRLNYFPKLPFYLQDASCQVGFHCPGIALSGTHLCLFSYLPISLRSPKARRPRQLRVPLCDGGSPLPRRGAPRGYPGRRPHRGPRLPRRGDPGGSRPTPGAGPLVLRLFLSLPRVPRGV